MDPKNTNDTPTVGGAGNLPGSDVTSGMPADQPTSQTGPVMGGEPTVTGGTPPAVDPAASAPPAPPDASTGLGSEAGQTPADGSMPGGAAQPAVGMPGMPADTNEEDDSGAPTGGTQ